MFIHVKKTCALSILVMSLSFPAYADDVTDTINEALKSYKEGQFSTAVEDLNYALELIQQQKGENLQSYLPKPLNGWNSKDATSQSAGPAMFGGGLSAERHYTKADASIKIQIVGDSPLMQGMMTMFTNPMFATSEGGKLERIGRQKAIVNYDPTAQSGNIKIVVAKRFMVSIEGKKVTLETLKAYAKAIDYKKLAALP